MILTPCSSWRRGASLGACQRCRLPGPVPSWGQKLWGCGWVGGLCSTGAPTRDRAQGTLTSKNLTVVIPVWQPLQSLGEGRGEPGCSGCGVLGAGRPSPPPVPVIRFVPEKPGGQWALSRTQGGPCVVTSGRRSPHKTRRPCCHHRPPGPTHRGGPPSRPCRAQ